MTGASVDIVVVNWQSRDLLRRCLQAVAQSAGASEFGAVVVDNASSDGSADGLDAHPARLTLIRNESNRGFGAACNQGAAAGDAPLVLFLNPDTRVSPDAVASARAYLAAHPAVGIVGARLVDDEGRTHRTTARLPTPRLLLGQALGLDRALPRLFPPHFVTEWDHADTRAVEQVMGAFLMIRRCLLAELGGFDERFFVYFEDVDLCARAAATGAAVVHLADATVSHVGGGTSERVKDRRLFYFLRSKALYVAKHHGRPAALAGLVVDLLLHLPIRMVTGLVRARFDQVGAAWGGAKLLVADLPGLMRRL